jgi:hypothetical protein
MADGSSRAALLDAGWKLATKKAEVKPLLASRYDRVPLAGGVGASPTHSHTGLLNHQ